MRTMLTAQHVIDRLGELLLLEMKYRNIPVSGVPMTLKRSLEHPDWTKIHEIIPYDAHERTLSLEEYAELRLWPVARTLGVKLARPFPLTSYELELPLGVFEAAKSSLFFPFIRIVSDYVLAEDAFMTRFDILVSWDETKRGFI